MADLIAACTLNWVQCAFVHYSYIVWHHDGKQGLVVGVEGHVESGGLNHDEDGMMPLKPVSQPFKLSHLVWPCHTPSQSSTTQPTPLSDLPSPTSTYPLPLNTINFHLTVRLSRCLNRLPLKVVSVEFSLKKQYRLIQKQCCSVIISGPL